MKSDRQAGTLLRQKNDFGVAQRFRRCDKASPLDWALAPEVTTLDVDTC